jgi:hypothetical protein
LLGPHPEMEQVGDGEALEREHPSRTGEGLAKEVDGAARMTQSVRST